MKIKIAQSQTKLFRNIMHVSYEPSDNEIKNCLIIMKIHVNLFICKPAFTSKPKCMATGILNMIPQIK